VELRRSCYLIAAPADLPSGRVLVVTLLYISSNDFSVEFKSEDTKHIPKSFVARMPWTCTTFLALVQPSTEKR
jgi:hypothetical protein